MLISLVANKAVPFDRVLVDSWYVTKDMMLFIESLGKIYCVPPAILHELSCRSC
jgi:hypothetical protein